MKLKYLSIYLLIASLQSSPLLLWESKAQKSFDVEVNLPDFESRSQMMIDSMASWASEFDLEDFQNSDDSEGGKYGAYPIMALFERGYIEQAGEFVAQQLIGGAAMFREFSTMALYMEYHELYDEELREKVKSNQIEKSNFFRVDAEVNDKGSEESHRNPRLGGASENHKLMYAAAAYLAGLAWPDDYPEEWAQIGYDHLMHWFEIVTSIGFWEEDSPTYLIHHMGPIVSVADHAPEGSEMKKRATMVLDWYFASIAGEYLHGYWITPAARDYNPVYGLSNSAESTALAWLMFGDAPQVPNPHIYQPFRHWKAALHFAISDYRVPEVIKAIATDRDQPFIHKEFMAKNPMRPKEYCYLNSTYGMASILNERSENIPPDMTRWKVQWISDNPEKEPSVFLMKHPRKDDKWEKWRGASYAEQVLQHKDALIAVYNIKDDQKNFIDGPFRKDAYSEIKIKDGWWFMHTGSNLLAVKAINGLELSDEKRMTDYHGPEIEMQVIRSQGMKNGLIVQTSALEPYDVKRPEKALRKFMKDVLENTMFDASGINDEKPVLRYKNLAGDVLEIKFNGYKRINGEMIVCDNWPLLGNPWMHQEYKGDELIIEREGKKRIYDFGKWEVREL